MTAGAGAGGFFEQSHLKRRSLTIQMSAASDTATCEKATDSFLAYCRDKHSIFCRRTGSSIAVDPQQEGVYETIVAWAETARERCLPIILRVAGVCIAKTRMIVAALDGNIRDAQGVVIATVAVQYGDKMLASPADILNWVAENCRTNLMCLVSPDAVIVPNLNGVSAQETCTRSDSAGELERCLRAAPPGAHLNNSIAFLSPYNARHAQLYACTEEQLDTAERALLRRGYVLPSWRSDAAHQAGVSLHSFIRQTFVRATLSYSKDESGELYKELVRYLGLVMALL